MLTRDWSAVGDALIGHYEAVLQPRAGARRRRERRVTTFAALGDSITVGIGDPAPVGPHGATWRGWAALLAEGMPEPRLHNLATAGAQAAEVERDQLPRALELRPDVASVIVGINDTLRAGFDPRRFARAAEHTVGALRSAGAEVLTMRLPDPGLMLGLPDALSRPLARRIHAVNAVIDDLAERFGTLVFDAAGDPETYDRRMWSVDRLHPSERGHRLIAGRFHDRLAAAGCRSAPARNRAVQPAADPPRPGRVDGHQRHRVGDPPLHRPRALSDVHGRQGTVGGSRPGPAATPRRRRQRGPDDGTGITDVPGLSPRAHSGSAAPEQGPGPARTLTGPARAHGRMASRMPGKLTGR